MQNNLVTAPAEGPTQKKKKKRSKMFPPFLNIAEEQIDNSDEKNIGLKGNEVAVWCSWFLVLDFLGDFVKFHVL